MHDDDEQIGRILSRREALGLLGLGGASLAVPTALGASGGAPFRLPACIVRPTQTEGPYFVDTELNRSAKGHIGLQNHDERSVIRFRNIHLETL